MQGVHGLLLLRLVMPLVCVWGGGCGKLVAYKYIFLSFELIEQSFPNFNMVSDRPSFPTKP
jgi:hypothetical protein